MTSEKAPMDRREFVTGMVSAATLAGVVGCRQETGGMEMFGLIGQLLAADDKRDELIDILIEGTRAMPGCISYVVAKDVEDDNAIWVTEVWESKESHAASLSLPAVQSAMQRGRPLMAGFGHRFETLPAGGHGVG